MISSLPETGRPILVFSGGEPLMRPDLFELAEHARAVGLPTALATNGTIMDEAVARRIVEVGIKRVSMSLDGPDAPTHDGFRGIEGAFNSTLAGFKLLRSLGMSMQINTTIARHNYTRLDDMYKLALDLGADALHIFMLVPVGCGMELSQEIMLKEDDYERALNWIYDKSLEGKLHLKATCAPHYFRVMKQRARAEGREMPLASHPHRSMGPVQALQPTGHPAAQQGGHPGAHPGGHPGGDMSAMTKGCLAARPSALSPTKVKFSPAVICRFPVATSKRFPSPPFGAKARSSLRSAMIPNSAASAACVNTSGSAWVAGPGLMPKPAITSPKNPIVATRLSG